MSIPRGDIERLGRSVKSIREIMESVEPAYAETELVTFDELANGLQALLPDYRRFVREASEFHTDAAERDHAIQFSEAMTLEDLTEVFYIAGLVEIEGDNSYRVKSSIRCRWDAAQSGGDSNFINRS